MDTSAQEVDVALLQVQREHFSFAHFSFIASKTAKESTREKKDNYLADKFFHAVCTISFQNLKPGSSGTARWKNFILAHSVELFKLYRIVLESWESVQAKDFVPLFQRGTIFKRVRMACRNARSSFERIDSR